MDFSPSEIDYFWKKVKKSKEACWEWQGKFFDSGYGRFFINNKSFRAHVVSYLLLKGDIPSGKLVCHTCDNPKCVNPNHLWIGSPKDNVQDMMRKGRLIRSRKKHVGSISKYPGISFRKETGKWRARIMRNYTNVLVGEFSTEEEAHIARNKALKDLSEAFP